MSGVGLPTAGRPLGRRKLTAEATSARFDDTAMQDAAAQAGSVIGARWATDPAAAVARGRGQCLGPRSGRQDEPEADAGEPARHPVMDWMNGKPMTPSPATAAKDDEQATRRDRFIWF